MLNHQILPQLGGYRLQEISPMQIQSLMAGLAGKSNSLAIEGLDSFAQHFHSGCGKWPHRQVACEQYAESWRQTGRRKDCPDPGGKQSASGTGQRHPG